MASCELWLVFLRFMISWVLEIVGTFQKNGLFDPLYFILEEYCPGRTSYFVCGFLVWGMNGLRRQHTQAHLYEKTLWAGPSCWFHHSPLKLRLGWAYSRGWKFQGDSGLGGKWEAWSWLTHWGGQYRCSGQRSPPGSVAWYGWVGTLEGDGSKCAPSLLVSFTES